MRDFQESLDRANKHLAEKQFEEELTDLNPRNVSKYTDKELALFQSRYPDSSPRGILATHEWQRRLLAEQAKTSRLVALVGIVGTLLGAIAGHFLTKWG